MLRCARTPARVALVNVDEQPELAERFGVSSIPTLMVVKDGEIIGLYVEKHHAANAGANVAHFIVRNPKPPPSRGWPPWAA